MDGLPRSKRYKDLPLETHLEFLDNDMDSADYRMEILAKSISAKLNWVVGIVVGLLTLFCGILLAALLAS